MDSLIVNSITAQSLSICGLVQFANSLSSISNHPGRGQPEETSQKRTTSSGNYCIETNFFHILLSPIFPVLFSSFYLINFWLYNEIEKIAIYKFVIISVVKSLQGNSSTLKNFILMNIYVIMIFLYVLCFSYNFT